MTMLEICKAEIDSIMASLDSQDMEEVSKQMEESEFAQTDLESELLLRFPIYLTLILKLNYILRNISYFALAGRTKKRDEDEL